MKKYLLISILTFLSFTGVAHALPTTRFEQNISPFVTNTYDFGTSTNIWKNVWTNGLHMPSESDGCAQFTSGALSSSGTPCGTGGGGGGSDGNWTFFNKSGIYVSTTTNQVLIGATATTSQPHALSKLIVVGDSVFIGHSTTTGVLSSYKEVRSPFFTATSTATSTFPTASITGRLYDTNGTGGTNGFVLQTTGSGITWVSTTTLGFPTGVPTTRALTVAGTASQITSSAGSQDLSADRTWTLSLPSHVIFPTSYQALYGSTTAATSSTIYATNFASTSKFFADGLVTCNSENMLTWSAGVFGCESDTSGSGSGSGNVATSSNETANYVPYWTSTAGTPALLGSDSGMQYNAASDILTILNASTTQLSAINGASFGATATSSFSSAGVLTLVTPLTVSSGGTGQNTFTSSQLLYGNGTAALSSVATSTLTVSTGLSYSGTMGSVVGGTSGTLTATLGTTIAPNELVGTPAASLVIYTNVAGTGFAGVATSSETCTSPITCTAFPVLGTGGAISLGTVGVANGGTGAGTLTGLLQGNGTSAITGVTGTIGQYPYYNGTNTLLATSTPYVTTASHVGIGTTTPVVRLSVFSLASTIGAVVKGSGTGAVGIGSSGTAGIIQAYTNDSISANANLILQPNALNVGIATATPASLLSVGNTNGINFSTATSSWSSTGGINLVDGCYAVDGICLATGGSGTVASGLQGQSAFYNAGGTTVSGTSTLFIAQSQKVGIGTTSPAAFVDIQTGTSSMALRVSSSTGATMFEVEQNGNIGIASSSAWGLFSINPTGIPGPSFVVGSSTKTDFVVTNAGLIGIGTTSPYARLSVVGESMASFFTATSTTATSTINGILAVGSSTDPQISMNPNGQAMFALGATSSPFAKFTIHTTKTDTLLNLVAVASSTQTSTTTHFLITNTGAIYAPNTTGAAGAQTGYWCYDANGQFIRDSAVCLVSAKKYKKDIHNLSVGLDELMKMRPVTYYKKDPLDKQDSYMQMGFIADEVAEIPELNEMLVVRDSKGEIRGFRYDQYAALTTKAIQELNDKVDQKTTSYWPLLGLLGLLGLKKRK